MSVLPDHRIRKAVADGTIGIEPFREKQIQPASYDLTLDRFFRTIPTVVPLSLHQEGERWLRTPMPPIDVKNAEHYETNPYEVGIEGAGFHLDSFALASTVERVRIPSHMVARVEGKSSLARLGLFVHVTAGFIDPGFRGHITLELFCANGRGMILYPGMSIAQISFERMESAADAPYGVATGSKYQNAPTGPTESRYWMNFQD